jgi:hypothetical protein
MKALKLGLACLLLAGATGESFSQHDPYSLNIVGYINRPILPGDNLIANQLKGNVDNTINNILLGVANGATFTKWDSSANAFLPLSTFSLGTWSINYTLNLGEGALIHSPSLTTNTFVGEVAVYTNIVPNLGPVGLHWAPNYADGLHLISCPMPVGGPVSSMFANVVGRAPEAGEWVKVLDESTQTYITSTFDGVNWDNGDLPILVSDSAWVHLGPAIVPEPSTVALSVLAGFAILGSRRRRH